MEKGADQSADRENAEFLPGFSSLESYTQDFLRTMSSAIKASNSLPSDRKEDWDYYTTFKSFRDVTSAQQRNIEKQITSLLKYNGIKARIEGSNVPHMLEVLADANDQILERVGIYLDEATGVRKSVDPLLVEVSQKPGVISGSWNKRPDGTSAGKETTGEQVKLLAAKNVQRPQVNFKDKIDNSLNPFMPRLTEKPHALKPLSILLEYDKDGNECYSHPYAFEIDNFRIPEDQMTRSGTDKFKYLPLEETSLEMVNTLEGLKSMVTELNKFSVIGVDLEAHTYRTYLGITCLIQISSEEKDYLVDPFPLWNDLTLLNDVLANPKVLKIFHGAIGDIGWLQRDFSVYVVNMFDTHIAAKLLEFPRGCLSLSFLLHHYCKVNAEKKYQLADWRIRPLISEMIYYARSDTHYLISIYHRMKNELLDKGNEQKNLLHAAYDQSNVLCKTIFTKPKVSHVPLLQKSKALFNPKQEFAFKEIYLWRNKLARTEDESENYVLPTHMLIKISSELPREMQGVLACCNPIPPMVKQHLPSIHEIILRAREQPLTSVAVDKNTENGSSEQDGISAMPMAMEIVEDPIRTPLDIGHFSELETGLITLLDSTDTPGRVKTNVKLKAKSVIEVFDVRRSAETRLEIKSFLTPFQRLQMLRPYLKAISDENPENLKMEDRIRSIKEHFEALTSMTPRDYLGPTVENQEATEPQVVEVVDVESEEESTNVGLEHFNPEPGQVKNWRQDLNRIRKKRKQKRNESRDDSKQPNSDKAAEEQSLPSSAPKKKLKHGEENPVDFTNVDFSQYSGGPKGGAKNSNEFNPWKNYDKKGKSGKQKQRYKPAAGKSVTYKK